MWWTRTVEDAAILLNYMARHDPRDPLSLPRTEPDYTRHLGRSLKGWKIGFTPDFGVFPVEPEVAELVERAALRFTEAGAELVPLHFSFRSSAEEMGRCWCRAISVDTAMELELWKREGLDLVRDHRADLPEAFICYNDLAAKGGILDYYCFNCIRTDIFDQLQTALTDCDLLLSPTVSCLPVKNAVDCNTVGPSVVNGLAVDPLIGFCQTFLCNFTGHPAASVPAGLSRSGLPIGMQLIGRRFHDGDLFAASAAFEEIQPWKQQYSIPFSRSI